METDATPIVIVPACNRLIGEHRYQVAGQKYLDAVRLAGALPVVVQLHDARDLAAALEMAHGVLLTGSPANVHPSHFGQSLHDPSLPLDAERDASVLPLVPQALARGLPLLAICRGLQETNVALGGTLHQAVHEQPGFDDHRDDPDDPVAQQYAPAHPVEVVPGGVLAAITGRTRFEVNSLHGQAVDRLAPGLRVEAVAPDGLIEAFSVPDAPGFTLCVQWHPEWQAADNPVSMRLFAAFGDAVRRYRAQRVAAPAAAH